jgi:hypothetical protein
MKQRPLTLEIEDINCVVTPITTQTYFEMSQQSLSMAENYRGYWQLHRLLRAEAPMFDHPRLYTALRLLFGESSTAYDDYKCSFAYHFRLQLARLENESIYLLNLTDIKGNLSFLFRKYLATAGEREAYPDRNVLYQPFPDDFSHDQMAYFMRWFTFYLVGFMQVVEPRYDEPFRRELAYGRVVYGFENGRFFINSDQTG